MEVSAAPGRRARSGESRFSLRGDVALFVRI
jgi:hypothetical protein